ncbi:EamA family transporter, partial [Pseudomonas sp. K5002]|nr:EamA family transporter [Pseudomonas sp. K5002]
PTLRMLMGGALIIVAIVVSGLMGGAKPAKQPATTAEVH